MELAPALRAFRLGGEALREPRGSRVAFLNRGESFKRLHAAGFDRGFVHTVLIAEVNHLADAELAAPQLLAEAQQVFDADGRARNGAHATQLAALNAPRQNDLALAGQQGHRGHLAHVEAHGIIGTVHLARRQVELRLVVQARRQVRALNRAGVFGFGQALVGDGERLQVIRGVGFGRQQLIDVAEREERHVLAGLGQRVEIVLESVIGAWHDRSLLRGKIRITVDFAALCSARRPSLHATRWPTRGQPANGTGPATLWRCGPAWVASP